MSSSTLNLVGSLIRSFSGIASSFKRACDALEHYKQELIREEKQENLLSKRSEQIDEGVRQILDARGLKADAESVARLSGQIESLKAYTNMLPEKKRE